MPQEEAQLIDELLKQKRDEIIIEIEGRHFSKRRIIRCYKQQHYGLKILGILIIKIYDKRPTHFIETLVSEIFLHRLTRTRISANRVRPLT